MLELNVVVIAIIAVMTVVGAVLGWIVRGKRAQDEKAAVNAGWRDQISAQRTEHDRLTEQNKALMEQINQYQASNKDAKNRAKELSEAVQEAFARRDELQREIKDIRGNLEIALSQRDQLQSDMSVKEEEHADVVAQEARIKKLQRDLEDWQNRLPPLIEKYRQRNADAEKLEEELDHANERIAELEATAELAQTRVEAVRDPETLTDGRDASNDPIDRQYDEDSGEEEPEEAAAEERSEESVEDSDIEIPNEHDDVDEDNALVTTMTHARDRLQAIKGVGPAIEKTLNEMGIFSYQQIAEMSEYDIDRVANRLKGFRTRIYREDWIGQARDLRDQPLGD